MASLHAEYKCVERTTILTGVQQNLQYYYHCRFPQGFLSMQCDQLAISQVFPYNVQLSKESTGGFTLAYGL